ncbi:MAG: prolipoprotein diacylglyceryl transferase [bacterium]|nr:MAG: prolipoprotein diacylglyceryl transferase [bacterium]
MLPELFQIGGFTLHTYGVLVALGILAGVALSEHLNRRQGGEPGRFVDISFILVLSGLIGARLFFVLVNLDYYLDDPVEIFMVWQGGLVFFGGLVGGLLGLLAAIRLYRLPLWHTMDIAAPGLALGHTLGRLGCFSAGCCYGRPTGLPWAVTFTDPRCLATDVLDTPVHPTQLYSAVFLAVLVIFLVWRSGRKRFPGEVAALYVGLYSSFRFGVEFYRADPRGMASILGITLSTSQITALVLLPIAVGAYVYLERRKNRP